MGMWTGGPRHLSDKELAKRARKALAHAGRRQATDYIERGERLLEAAQADNDELMVRKTNIVLCECYDALERECV